MQFVVVRCGDGVVGRAAQVSEKVFEDGRAVAATPRAIPNQVHLSARALACRELERRSRQRLATRTHRDSPHHHRATARHRRVGHGTAWATGCRLQGAIVNGIRVHAILDSRFSVLRSCMCTSSSAGVGCCMRKHSVNPPDHFVMSLRARRARPSQHSCS